MPTPLLPPARRGALLLAVLVLTFAGCGTPNHSPGNTTLEGSSDSSGQPAGPLGFTATAEGPGGDTVEIKASFTDAVAPAESGVPADALASCGADERALVVQMDLETTLTSSMPANVSIRGFSGPITIAKSSTMHFLLDYADGATCVSPGDDSHTMRQQLQPNSPNQFRGWIVLPGVITPDNPNPAQAALGEWAMTFPTISFNDDSPVTSVHGEGPRLACPASSFEGQALVYVAGVIPEFAQHSC